MRLYGTFGSIIDYFTCWQERAIFRMRVNRPRPSSAQALFSLLLIGMVEFARYWRQILSEIAPLFNLQLSAEFSKTGDIERIVTCTAPVFWIFLPVDRLFSLRLEKQRTRSLSAVPSAVLPDRPTHILLLCAFMLWRSTAWALKQEPAEAFIVGGLMLVGIPLCIFSENCACCLRTTLRNDFLFPMRPNKTVKEKNGEQIPNTLADRVVGADCWCSRGHSNRSLRMCQRALRTPLLS